MSVYIYEDVDVVSGGYHPEGGVTIITDRDPAEVWAEQGSDEKYGEWKPSALPEPSAVIPVGQCPGCADGPTEEKVFIFPDAGCC